MREGVTTRGWSGSLAGGRSPRLGWCALAATGWVVLTGCAAPHTPYPESFNSFRPEERILAARHAAEIGDRKAIPLLVDRLEDDDSAVRMFAILALDKLTGTRLGYNYADGDLERARAVERWRRQVRENAASQPGSTPVHRASTQPTGGSGE